MIKKLLPAMIGAALIGGMSAAQADVTVFGHIDTSVRGFDTDKNFVTLGKTPGGEGSIGGWGVTPDDTDDVNFVCTTCSIGFKGSEDLGNGLKAIFSLDFQFDTINRNSNGSITDRDQWLGLAGNFGSVKVGTISTSYKSHGAMIDPLYRTAAQGRDHNMQSFLHSNAGEDGQGRADNTLRWDSPSWNGLKVTAHYTLDSNENDCSDASAVSGINCGEDDDGYGAGVQYSNGGILVFADYVTNDSDPLDTSAATGDSGNWYGDMSAWKVGGKYTLNNFAVYAQYEDIDVDLGANQEVELYHLAGSYTMGNNMLYLGYGNTSVDSDNIGNDPDVDSFTLAATHSMSKRTTLYAAYNMKEQDLDTGTPDDDPEEDVWAIGMKHKF